MLFGLLRSDRSLITELEYDEVATRFDERMAVVMEQEEDGTLRKGLVNVYGKKILPPTFLEIRPLGNLRYAAQNARGFWGLYDPIGNVILPHQYTEIGPFEGGKSIVRIGLKQGLIGPNGEAIIEAVHRDIRLDDGAYRVTPFRKVTLADLTGSVINEFYFEKMEDAGEGVFRFEANGKWGLVSETGDVIFYGLYDRMWPFEKEVAVVEKEGLKGAIDRKGNLVLPLSFQEVIYEPSGMFRAVKPDGQTDLYNPLGFNLTKGQYTKIGVFTDSLYHVEANGKAFFTDLTFSGPWLGKVFDHVTPFVQGAAAVVENGQYGVIDRQGHWLIAPHFDSTVVVSNRFFVVYEPGCKTWNIVDRKGVELYRSDLPWSVRPDGHLTVHAGEKVGLMNAWGSPVIPPVYDSIGMVLPDQMVLIRQGNRTWYMDLEEEVLPSGNPFANSKVTHYVPSEKLFPASIQGTFGFVDYLGRLRIGNQFEDARPFSDGLASVKLGNKWGYINRLENLVLQPAFDAPAPFVMGLAIVRRANGNKKFGVIDKKGQEVIPFQYDKIELTPHGNFKVWQGDKIGIYGKNIFGYLYPRFSALEDLGNGFVLVTLNGKMGVSRIDGVTVAYPEYTEVVFNPLDQSFFLYADQEPFSYK
jgi:hypothetical protein